MRFAQEKSGSSASKSSAKRSASKSFGVVLLAGPGGFRRGYERRRRDRLHHPEGGLRFLFLLPFGSAQRRSLRLGCCFPFLRFAPLGSLLLALTLTLGVDELRVVAHRRLLDLSRGWRFDPE